MNEAPHLHDKPGSSTSGAISSGIPLDTQPLTVDSFIKEIEMEKGEIPICPHCSQEMKKWVQPEDSTWTAEFYWVCFNDECPYYVKGWDFLKETQGVKASYRHKLDPETGKTGPLPAWSDKAHRDRIVEE